MHLRCPHCRNAFELLDDSSATEVVCPSCHSKISFEELLSLDPSITESLDVEAMTFLNEGETIAHFTIRETVGRGGFGTVYRAFDQHLERDVAIKMPRMQKLTRWQAESFIREAQAAAQLRDPNIVTVHEVGRKDNQIYIVSDFIDGISLTQWKKQFNPTQQEIASMMATIARSLHKAHQRGIIHRDMKPGNVMVDSEGSPHITDFGLAKRENPEEISITTTGQVIGTPAYMSPEQASGHADQADGRTDVYSMGVILYELLAGKRPFRGESDLLINEVREGNPEPIRVHNSAVNPDLEAIAMKAMAVKPGQRFATAETFADDLERYTEGRPTLTRPPGPARKAILFARRHAVAMTIAALLLTIVGLTAYFLNRPEPEKKTETPLIEVVCNVAPVDATVNLVRLAFDDGRYDTANTKSVTTLDGRFAVELRPGYYVVECYGSGGYLSESIRFVPNSTKSDDKVFKRNLKLLSGQWDINKKGQVVWHDITMVQGPGFDEGMVFSLGPERMTCVAGATFNTNNVGGYGLDEQLIRNNGNEFVGSVAVALKEVSVGNFKQVMGYIPLPYLIRFPKAMEPDFDNSRPVCNVSYLEAADYCERVGGRLPSFNEFLLVATNAGKSKYPWGDQAEPIDTKSWPIVRVGEPEYDRSRHQTPIENLYSSAFEWTSDFNPVSDPITQKPIRQGGMNSGEFVIVSGGPYGNAIMQRDFESEDRPLEGPRYISTWPLKTDGPDGLGFRVYRGFSPRFSPNDSP